METVQARPAPADDQRFGLTETQIESLAGEILAEIRRPPAAGSRPGAFYFRRRDEAGDWLTQGLGLHPDGDNFLVFDFPQIDDPYAYHSRLETVYLPSLQSPAAARQLVEQVLGNDQPRLQPLLELPRLLIQPESDQPDRHQELAAAVSRSLERTRDKLAAAELDWRLGRALVSPETTVDDPDPREAIVEFLETSGQIHRVGQVAEAINAGRREPIERRQIGVLLAKLRRDGRIQSTCRAHYAARQLDLTGFRLYQLPGLISHRVLDLIASDPGRGWDNQTITDRLNQAGHRLAPPPVTIEEVKTGLGELSRTGRIKSIQLGVYAAPEHPQPAYHYPGSLAAERLVDLLDQNPEQGFTKAQITAALAGQPDFKPPAANYVSKLTGDLDRDGRIKRIKAGVWASPNHPDPPYQPPAEPISTRVLDTINSQADRRWNPAAIGQILNRDPGQTPLEPHQIRNSLSYLAEIGRIQPAGHGHYTGLDPGPAEARLPRRGVGRQLAALCDSQPEQVFDCQLARAAIEREIGQAPQIRTIQDNFRRLSRAGRIKRVIDRDHYASLANQLPEYLADRTVVKRLEAIIPGWQRDFSQAEAAAALAQDGGRLVRYEYVGDCLRRLARQGKIKPAGDRGRWEKCSRPARPAKAQKKPRRQPDFESESDLYLVAPPPPKSEPRVSLGRRIGPIARAWPGRATPAEIADAVENDGNGPVNRATCEELAESVLRRLNKLVR